MSIEELRTAHEFTEQLIESCKKNQEAMPIWAVDRMAELWKETLNLCKPDSSSTFYISEFEGEQAVVNRDGCEVWPFFREVASIIAMSDLSEQTITKIVFQGKEFHYVGWKPGMEFTFVDGENSENAYTTWMPHLDH